MRERMPAIATGLDSDVAHPGRSTGHSPSGLSACGKGNRVKVRRRPGVRLSPPPFRSIKRKNDLPFHRLIGQALDLFHIQPFNANQTCRPFAPR